MCIGCKKCNKSYHFIMATSHIWQSEIVITVGNRDLVYGRGLSKEKISVFGTDRRVGIFFYKMIFARALAATALISHCADLQLMGNF